MARSGKGRSTSCFTVFQVWGQCSVLRFGRAWPIFWSSWPLKEETKTERKSCLLGMQINLPFLQSCLEGLEGHLEWGNASGACYPLSTLHSHLQKTLSPHWPPLIPTQEWRQCWCSLLAPHSPESLEGRFHTATSYITAQDSANQKAY